jgi:hypothetical protein
MANADPVVRAPRRFSIRVPRALWIGVATFGLIIAGLSLIAVRYYLQGVAIREMNAVGGSVDMRQQWPEWLRERIGAERLRPYDEPVYAKLSYSRARDEDLGQLRRLQGLKRLDCNGTKITDAGLVHVGGITSLQWLWLADTPVTDAGLAHLKGLTGLRELWLNGTGITDAGLAHLKDLTGLEWLFLRGTRVSDDGIANLKRDLPALQIGR